jgi:hypothetical protein
MEGQPGAPDGHWHVGLVVDERSRVRALAEAAGAILDGPFLDFLDPWVRRKMPWRTRQRWSALRDSRIGAGGLEAHQWT